MKRIRIPFYAVLLAAILLAGCSLGQSAPAPQQPTVNPDQVLTQAAETIVAELTQAAPPATATLEAPAAPLPTDTPPLPPTDTPVVIITPPPATDTPLPSATPPATDTPEPSPTVVAPSATLPLFATANQTFQVVFQDDFAANSFWTVDRSEDWVLRYNLGGYVIFVDVPNVTIWSVKSQGYSDVSVEVDASKISGPRNGYYGLACRHQDGGNYYALVVSGDGTYGILKQKTGRPQWLIQSTQPSGAILGGTSVNRLRADCIGATLSLYVNGQKLAEVQDPDFSSGSVGLAAGTLNLPGMEALFDNIVIMAP